MLVDFLPTLLSFSFCLFTLPKKRTEIHIFMISLLFIALGYTINILWHADLIDNTKVVFDSLYYTVLIEALLFSIANSYRLRRLQKQEEENIRNQYLLEIKNELIHQQNVIIQERTESLETFLYKASHDLKGPLKSIDGLCDLGKKEKNNSSVYFDFILKSSQRLQGILESLLGLAKQRSQVLTISTIPLAELIHSCILQSLKEHPGISTITIKNNIPKEVTLRSDYFSIYSVVQNIMENAIKYQDAEKDERVLEISYESTYLGHRLFFKDNGIGIPSKSMDHIFEMFYRANTTDSSGVGLGLYIVKQTVQLLKGKISIESKEKKYTHVIIDLPISPDL
jgi:signal transduction histidine kinase